MLSFFLNIQSQFKVLHWQTQSYARHIAFGETYTILDGLIDNFVETYIGKYGKLAFEQDSIIQISNIGEIELDDFLETIISYLLSLNDSVNELRDSDLLNIRDEMLAQINKLKYLLTLQ